MSPPLHEPDRADRTQCRVVTRGKGHRESLPRSDRDEPPKASRGAGLTAETTSMSFSAFAFFRGCSRAVTRF